MSKDIKVEIHGTGDMRQLVIREGKALDMQPPVPVKITGTITSPAIWLEKRQPSPEYCHVIIDRDKMTITLVENEGDHYQNKITGAITPSPEFTKWGINNPETQYHSLELAQKIRMNRYQFSSLEKATELVTVFQNLKAKVQREIEHSDNQRGNAKKSFTQVVNEMTIPERFEIIAPIFKGDAKRTIPVEIVIDAESLKCSLISPEANDIMARERDALIEGQIAKIAELEPAIVIIEI